jgi:glycine cleavage system regulatory protein
MTDLVLTLIGPDRPGLVESVAEVVAAHGGNWLESRMAQLAGKFAGVLRVELPADRTEPFARALAGLESRGLRIVVEPCAPGGAPVAQRTLELSVLGMDRPGIVREISQLLASHGVNVEELTTDRSSAPMSGDMLFSARARLHAPADLDLAVLRAGLERIAHDLMVDLSLVESHIARRRGP